MVAIQWEDSVVIALYFIGVLGVGLWSSIKSKRDSVSGYFLASRNMHWIPVGASLFASNIGSGHFVGLAGSGASSGIAIAGFELNALFILLLLGWIFVPVYMASGVYTMPEYLKRRFGGQRIQIYLSVLALLLYVFTKISADLFSGAIFIKQSVDLNLYGAMVALLAIAALFTIAGGLTAVIWTDFIQTILMVAGALGLMVLSFVEVGGYEQLIKKFQYAMPANYVTYDNGSKICNGVPGNYMHLLRSVYDPELPWTGMVIGITISGVWYWCSDQVIVQRALSSKDMSHAKAGCILAGYLKLLPMFLLVFPGMAARILYPEEVACSDPKECYKYCGSYTGCTNIAYPLMVVKLMPKGARGLMLSVMLAALMSSLTSIFNSSSTIFTMDIWRKIRKNSSEMELLIVGRLFVLVLVGVSIAWVPIIQQFGNSQLFHYIQTITSILAPPVCAVYVLAILWGRINEKGAFWGLMTGLIVGIIRFCLEFSYSTPACGEPDMRPSVLTQVHYLHFGCLLFVITCCVTTAVSLLTEPMPEEQLYRLTFTRRYDRPRVNQIAMGTVPPLTDDSEKVMGTVNPAFQNEKNDSYNNGTTTTTVAHGDKFSDVTLQEPQRDNERPLWKKCIFFLCGISSELEKSNDRPAETNPVDEIENPLEEKPRWRRLCNANAIILLVVGSFVWGFYA